MILPPILVLKSLMYYPETLKILLEVVIYLKPRCMGVSGPFGRSLAFWLLVDVSSKINYYHRPNSVPKAISLIPLLRGACFMEFLLLR